MAEERKRYAIILAGGVGERFWPLSRTTRPKQLLPLGEGGNSLLADAIERLDTVIPPEDIYVVTGRSLLETIRYSGLTVPRENVIAEPAKRNTAGALVWAAAWLLATKGEEALDASLSVFPADQKVDSVTAFRADVTRAVEHVEQEGGLMVMGVPPARPATGYGYIEIADPVEEGDLILPVSAFHEKPDEDTAREYVGSGRHFWNSGMFFWTISDFLLELEKASPIHFETTGLLVEAIGADNQLEIQNLFEQLEDISIDYALMEKAAAVSMVPASFSWDDLGSWDALMRTLDTDDEGNLTLGPSILTDTRDCMVLNDEGDRASVALLGVEGLTVVMTGDAVLVMRSDRAQDVRKVVEQLKERGSPHL
ncbi:mannose-1-phosphate guanylyltransferase [Gemmatimonadota bacterium]